MKTFSNYSKVKKSIYIAATIYFITSIILYPERAINASKNALLLCANILIPSLFPFFVFSSLLISLGFAELICRPMSKLMGPLFAISGKGALCLVLGIISGYPLGAVCVCDMYNSGALTKREAEKLLAFCNNSGPLFIIGCVGASMFANQKIGIILYIIHILSSLITGGFLCLFSREKNFSNKQNISLYCAKPLSEIIKNAVSNSMNNILLVCGFTVLFSVITASLKPLFPDSEFSLFLFGLLEISTGLQAVISSALSINMRLMLVSAIIGFAGISVHFQVLGITAKTDLDTKLYFIGKALHSLIAALLTVLIFKTKYAPAYAEYMYPLRAAELIDFTSAMKLSVLYLASTVLIMLLFWLLEKIYYWKESVKHKKKSGL